LREREKEKEGKGRREEEEKKKYKIQDTLLAFVHVTGYTNNFIPGHTISLHFFYIETILKILLSMQNI